jgi:aryl-alcohol dehydrogenase-like predicted oxidoreductase
MTDRSGIAVCFYVGGRETQETAALFPLGKPRFIIANMERRKFGDTQLEVSAISLGCWIFGVDWWGHYSDEQAVKLCQFSYDQGITFFDNGDAYGNGRAETLFGKFLRESGIARDKVEIGSKFGYDIYSDPGHAGSHKERKQDFSPAFMRSSLEKSLQRLGVDMIDLYMAHNIKLPQYRDDLFAELEKIRDEGKIRAWGVSLGPAIGWREEGFKAVLDHNAKAIQTVFNLFEQNPGARILRSGPRLQSGRSGPGSRQQLHPERRGEDRYNDRQERSPPVPR